jgi:hypothetical protein
MNVVINIANKKKLLLFEEIEQSLQDSEDTVLIMNSAIVYYQRMIYLKKKHDILEERNQELKSEKINQENNRQSILAKYNSDLQEKKTERDSKVQEINNANQQLNDETTLLKQINLVISEAKKSKPTAEKNKKVSDTALTKAKIDKHVELRNAINETSQNTNDKELQENIEKYKDASQLDAIRYKFKSKPHVIKKIDAAVKAKTKLAQAQLTSDSVNDALSVIEDSISNAKNRISEKQRLIDALKETKRLAELEISSIDEAIKLLLVKRNEDIQTFDKNIQTNDENIRVNDTIIQEIKGIVPKRRDDSSEDLKEIILTTGEIDIFRNFGIFPLYSRDEYLSDEQMERYLKGYVEYIPPPSKIIDYLISQEAVDKLFLFCGLNGIEQKKSCMDFFKLHNCKFSKENIILIDTQIKMLLVNYTKNKQIVKKATKAATTKVREELNRAKKAETEVKNKLFIAMLIKVCVSGNVKFYGLDESLDEIELQYKYKLYNKTLYCYLLEQSLIFNNYQVTYIRNNLVYYVPDNLPDNEVYNDSDNDLQSNLKDIYIYIRDNYSNNYDLIFDLIKTILTDYLTLENDNRTYFLNNIKKIIKDIKDDVSGDIANTYYTHFNKMSDDFTISNILNEYDKLNEKEFFNVEETKLLKNETQRLFNSVYRINISLDDNILSFKQGKKILHELSLNYINETIQKFGTNINEKFINDIKDYGNKLSFKALLNTINKYVSNYFKIYFKRSGIFDEVILSELYEASIDNIIKLFEENITSYIDINIQCFFYY